MISVVKLGGSLLAAQSLAQCLQKLQGRPEQVVVVPGGGRFADLVRSEQRQWGFDDLTAHRLAILAMQQMAWLCRDRNPAFSVVDRLSDFAAAPRLAIWSPALADLEPSAIDASWDVTSDSLAAWLATQLKAEALMLVKAAPIASQATLAQLRRAGIVDAAFLRYADPSRYTVTVINQEQFLATP